MSILLDPDGPPAVPIPLPIPPKKEPSPESSLALAVPSGASAAAADAIDSSESALVPSAEPPPEMKPRVQNLIASVQLGRELDLKSIALSTRNSEFNPKKINAVVMRIREPRCTALVFRTGRMMISGSKTEKDAKLGGKRMARIIQKVGFPDVVFANFKVENVIASADVGFPVRLEGLAFDHRERCSYEPELFSGCVFRFRDVLKVKDERVEGGEKACSCTALVFVSGKVSLSGARSEEELHMAFRHLYPILLNYNKL
ncbi:unnamed protein product [Vitrella brassicaformis CCMP3155]|uniref:TATA-box-binding protein n=2 Tax=Vitrella brassicaformis TaxID=1169539 RepID=A0A0G4H1I7_VITBC|nr:unnamed protein product [Vitrella brassicaformis CCMP3155]|mmetsp:Transcript_8387/g.20497  ORF Transcript_8387/g.20497 Transcript_8387/m.20497 type:complete len:258 (+) Transcript_8387:63-836(+)|eukprot:CEM37223.1 unnamed protein product [Vitrella brassicaformis CCMP3155]